MSEAEAKRQLAAMLTRYTPGSVLHLLAEVLRELAEREPGPWDDIARERLETAEAALYTFGVGLDAVYPR